VGIDATASAALDAAVIKPVYFAFVDFENEPVRVNTSGADVDFTGTGIAELDGFRFSGLRADAVDIGPVANKSAGTDSLLITLSGLQGLDDDMLAEIADPAHWRGREIRLWRVIRNAANVQQGGIQHYYTGNMTTLSLSANPDGQTIAVIVESYIAAYAAASNRTYLDQARYDAGDESARASIDIANNGGGSPGGSVGTGGNGMGGATIRSAPNLAHA
jgi:hypothetical protein